MKLKVLGDRIIARRLPAVSEGGIELAGGAEKQDRAVVVAVGAKCKTVINEGDRIIFDNVPKPTIRWEGEDLLVLYEAEVIGVIE